MELTRFERRLFATTRLSTLVAVLASLVGALVMFFLGVQGTWAAVELFLFGGPEADGLPRADAAVIYLIGALDRFLIGVVLLFFAYGLYSLFARPDREPRELGLPDWLDVESIGQLKQTLAEVILVVLFVLFLRVALKTFHAEDLELDWRGIVEFLLLPFSIPLLAGGLKLAELHPKPTSAHGGRPSPSAIRAAGRAAADK